MADRWSGQKRARAARTTGRSAGSGTPRPNSALRSTASSWGAAVTASRRVTQLFVASPPIDCASPTRAVTCRPVARPVSCQHSSTIWARPVAASGWPRALSPPDGFTGSRPSSAVSPSSVPRPALPGGTSPVSSIEISSNGREGVVELGHVDPLGAEAGHRERRLRRLVGRAEAREVVPVADGEVSVPCPMPAIRTARRLGRSTTRRRAVGDRAAVEEPQRIGHEPALHDRLERHRLLEVREGLRAPFAWFLTATWRDLPERGPGRCIHARVTRPASAGIVAP